MEVWFICLLVSLFLFLIYLGMKIHKNFVTNDELIKNTRDNPEQNGSKYIPKKIHQILIRDGDKIPEHFAKNINYIKNLNKGWEHYLYNEDDIVKYLEKNYPKNILIAYQKINPDYRAARADFFRYLVIYKEGGAYFDIKSAMKTQLDSILKTDDEYILAHWSCPSVRTIWENNKIARYRLNTELGEFQQWHVISRPGHPYLKNVIDNILKNIETYNPVIDGTGKTGVFYVTGPYVYTDSIMPILNDHKHTIYESSDDIGLIYNNCISIFSINHKQLFSKKHYSKFDSPIINKTL